MKQVISQNETGEFNGDSAGELIAAIGLMIAIAGITVLASLGVPLTQLFRVVERLEKDHLETVAVILEAQLAPERTGAYGMAHYYRYPF